MQRIILFSIYSNDLKKNLNDFQQEFDKQNKRVFLENIIEHKARYGSCKKYKLKSHYINRRISMIIKTNKISITRKYTFLKKIVTVLLLFSLIITSTTKFDIFNISRPVNVQAREKSIMSAFNRNGIILAINQKFKLKLSEETLKDLEEEAKENEEDYDKILNSITWKIKKEKVASIKINKSNPEQCEVTGLKFGYTDIVASVDIGDNTKKFTCNIDVFDSKKVFSNLNVKLKKHDILIRPCTTNSAKSGKNHLAFVELRFDFLKEKKDYVDTIEGVIHKKGLWKDYEWDAIAFESKDDYNNYVDNGYMPEYDEENYNMVDINSEYFCEIEKYKNVFSHPYIYCKSTKDGFGYILYGCDNKDGSGKKYR